MNKYGEASVNVFGKNRKLDVPGDAKVAQRYCFINQRVIDALHTLLVYIGILIVRSVSTAVLGAVIALARVALVSRF